MFQKNQIDDDSDLDVKAVDKTDEKSIQFFYKEEFMQKNNSNLKKKLTIRFLNANADEINQLVQQFEPSQLKDEPRHQVACKDGGKQCRDEKLISAMRSTGKYIIQQVGKKILSGDFNLTKISFPVRAMVAKSALERTFNSAIFFPLYVNRAFIVKNSIERFKLVITATIASFYINQSFHKPLNPIIGETVAGHLEDGTQLYSEQISHHPPISYFFATNDRYQYYGYYVYEARSGLNSITLKNNGKRFVRFKDGQMIEYNFAYESYSGTIMGTMKVETLGKLVYIDRKNNIVANIQLGKVKKRPTDYFDGDIQMDGIQVSQIYGSYMGFIEFDGIRYWDVRESTPFKVTVDKSELQSDASQRLDLQFLQLLDIQGAQSQKEKLEHIQRNDAILKKQKQVPPPSNKKTSFFS